MSRRVFAAFIAACVITGATVNAGVAWLCAWAAHPSMAPGASVPGAWPRKTPAAWGATAANSYMDVRFGAQTCVYFDSEGESIHACGRDGSSVTYDGTRRQVEVVYAGWPLAAFESTRRYDYRSHSEWGSTVDDCGEWTHGSTSHESGGCTNAGTFESGWSRDESSDEGVAGLTYPLMPRTMGFALDTLFWAGVVAVGVGFVRYGSVPRILGGSGGQRVAV